jgi:hypothetical protein
MTAIQMMAAIQQIYRINLWEAFSYGHRHDFHRMPEGIMYFCYIRKFF